MARCAIVGFLSAMAILAQDPVRIEGTVVEASNGGPVPGAKIVLSHAHFVEQTSATDASGQFRFVIPKSGSYTVEVTAPGFLPAAWGGPGVVIAESAFAEGAKPLVHTITVRLQKISVIRGRLRDGETAEPVASATVKALHLTWAQGRRRVSDARTATTDVNGDFRLESLAPGDYVLEISNKPANSDSEKKYPILLWPGNDPNLLQPIHLQSGDDYYAGNIEYSRRRLPRLTLTPQRDCRDATRYQVQISQMMGTAQLLRQSTTVSCPATATLDSLPPGRYSLQYFAGSPGGWNGYAEIDLRNGVDQDFELSPMGVPSITGKVSCDCEDRSKLQTVSLSLHGDGTYSVFLGVRRDHTFHATLVPGAMQIAFRQLPPGIFVKEIRRGGLKTGPHLNLLPNEAATLEITLSDRPATLAGAVMRGDKPVPASHVILAEWPLSPDSIYPDVHSSDSDSAGAFTFKDLPPGQYRVVAVGEEQWIHKEEPNVIASWFSGAQEITLNERQAARITVEAK